MEEEVPETGPTAAMTSGGSVSRLSPAVTAGASVSYVAGGAPVALDAGLSVADAAAINLSAAQCLGRRVDRRLALTTGAFKMSEIFS
ncbi:MAG: hypothetical protein JOY52_20175, partial [Hyphomicrobiales bacterium]|nr:hypothetical protein [Hyphomicrobiales bacterium]